MAELSSKAQEYSPPDKVKKKSGYKPTNCAEEEVISNLSTREAYRFATAYINEDRSKNCCTIEADNAVNMVKLWKATELPVKLTKADRSMTFLYAKGLKYLK